MRSPRPTGATQVVPSSGPPGSSAPTEGVGSCRNHPGQRRTAKRLRRGWEEWVESEAEITPEVSSNAGQCQLPLHKGAFGDGGCGLPCRFAPRNDSPDPLSFRGGPTGRRGNPSFLQWTGVRAAVPRAWPPPTKFRSEIWGVGQVVGPYGKPKPAGAQRSVRARGREGWAGIGARTIPKGGPPPRPLRQRLAKRKARKEELVKFSLCPMTSECSTGYRVRRSQPGPARAHADVTSSEQNGLAPRPAARQGASRARNCAATSVFSFDGSTAVFFLGLTKKKMGVESPPGLPGTPGRLTGLRHAVPRSGRRALRATASFAHGSLFPCGGRGTPFPAGVCCLRSGRQGRRVFSPWMGVSISGALNQAFRIWTAAGVMLAPAPAFSTTMATAISGSS